MLFFFNDTATTEICTLSLHDALPIYTITAVLTWSDGATSIRRASFTVDNEVNTTPPSSTASASASATKSPTASTSASRSEEHTSELQSRQYLVCRLLLAKNYTPYTTL